MNLHFSRKNEFSEKSLQQKTSPLSETYSIGCSPELAVTFSNCHNVPIVHESFGVHTPMYETHYIPFSNLTAHISANCRHSEVEAGAFTPGNDEFPSDAEDDVKNSHVFMLEKYNVMKNNESHADFPGVDTARNHFSPKYPNEKLKKTLSGVFQRKKNKSLSCSSVVSLISTSASISSSLSSPSSPLSSSLDLSTSASSSPMLTSTSSSHSSQKPPITLKKYSGSFFDNYLASHDVGTKTNTITLTKVQGDAEGCQISSESESRLTKDPAYKSDEMLFIPNSAVKLKKFDEWNGEDNTEQNFRNWGETSIENERNNSNETRHRYARDSIRDGICERGFSTSREVQESVLVDECKYRATCENTVVKGMRLESKSEIERCSEINVDFGESKVYTKRDENSAKNSSAILREQNMNCKEMGVCSAWNGGNANKIKVRLTSNVLSQIDKQYLYDVFEGSPQDEFLFMVKERADLCRENRTRRVCKSFSGNGITYHDGYNYKMDDRMNRNVATRDVDDGQSDRSSEVSTKGNVNHRCRNDNAIVNLCENPSDLWYGLQYSDGKPVCIRAKANRMDPSSRFINPFSKSQRKASRWNSTAFHSNSITDLSRGNNNIHVTKNNLSRTVYKNKRENTFGDRISSNYYTHKNRRKNYNVPSYVMHERKNRKNVPKLSSDHSLLSNPKLIQKKRNKKGCRFETYGKINRKNDASCGEDQSATYDNKRRNFSYRCKNLSKIYKENNCAILSESNTEKDSDKNNAYNEGSSQVVEVYEVKDVNLECKPTITKESFNQQSDSKGTNDVESFYASRYENLARPSARHHRAHRKWRKRLRKTLYENVNQEDNTVSMSPVIASSDSSVILPSAAVSSRSSLLTASSSTLVALSSNFHRNNEGRRSRTRSGRSQLQNSGGYSNSNGNNVNASISHHVNTCGNCNYGNARNNMNKTKNIFYREIHTDYSGTDDTYQYKKKKSKKNNFQDKNISRLHPRRHGGKVSRSSSISSSSLVADLSGDDREDYHYHNLKHQNNSNTKNHRFSSSPSLLVSTSSILSAPVMSSPLSSFIPSTPSTFLPTSTLLSTTSVASTLAASTTPLLPSATLAPLSSQSHNHHAQTLLFKLGGETSSSSSRRVFVSHSSQSSVGSCIMSSSGMLHSSSSISLSPSSPSVKVDSLSSRPLPSYSDLDERSVFPHSSLLEKKSFAKKMNNNLSQSSSLAFSGPALANKPVANHPSSVRVSTQPASSQFQTSTSRFFHPFYHQYQQNQTQTLFASNFISSTQKKKKFTARDRVQYQLAKSRGLL